MSRRALFLTLLLTSAAAAQGQEIGKFTVDGEVTCTALDAKDYGSLLGFANGALTVFPTKWEKVIQLLPFPAHKKGITGGAFTPEGDFAVTASLDGTLKVWDAETCKKYVLDKNEGQAPPVPTPKRTISAHTSGATAVTVSPTGEHILSGGTDGAIKVWDLKTGKLVHAISGAHAGAVKGVQFRPKADQVVSAGADRLVKSWDTKKWTPVQKSEAIKAPINSLAVSPDGARIAVAAGAPSKKDRVGPIRVLDAETLRESFTLKGHEDGTTCVAFHPAKEELASGGADKVIRVWDLGTKEQASHAENAEPLRGLAITPASPRFAAVSATRVRWFNGFGERKKDD
ncbi:MAG TPA: WD40 repeat domain-containing protein [Gemmataceae bacterium]|jgi:WD40 repeat protein|nr:WD40 repeat domain-containing protein [Gemmataceae bacterium]